MLKLRHFNPILPEIDETEFILYEYFFNFATKIYRLAIGIFLKKMQDLRSF